MIYIKENNIHYYHYSLDKDDTYLGFKTHNGLLAANQEYTETITLKIPRKIFGNFFIIVVTDATNNVYENLGENDNTMTAKV